MANSTTFVIVGGGLAGAKAVEALRDNDSTADHSLRRRRTAALRTASAVQGVSGRKEVAGRIHRARTPTGTATTTSSCGSARGWRRWIPPRTPSALPGRQHRELRQAATGHRIGVQAATDTRIGRRRGPLPAHLRRCRIAEFRSGRGIFAGHGRRRLDRPGGGRQRPSARGQRHRRRDRQTTAAGRTRRNDRRGVRQPAPRTRGGLASRGAGRGDHRLRRRGRATGLKTARRVDGRR